MDTIDGLTEYLEHIRQDFCKWQSYITHNNEIEKEVRAKLRQEFCDNVRYTIGSKYIRVITGTSVHSFICRKDIGKFKKGDILKAAGWPAPATNFSRGNIIARDFSRVSWTGAA